MTKKPTLKYLLEWVGKNKISVSKDVESKKWWVGWRKSSIVGISASLLRHSPISFRTSDQGVPSPRASCASPVLRLVNARWRR